jgi:hypothetical protein
MVRPLRFVACPLSGLRPDVSGCGLARKRFTEHLRGHRPFHGSGHNRVHNTVQPSRNNAGPVFTQGRQALGYALLNGHRIDRHGPSVEAELGQHRRVVGAGGTTVTCTPRDLNS